MASSLQPQPPPSSAGAAAAPSSSASPAGAVSLSSQGMYGGGVDPSYGSAYLAALGAGSAKRDRLIRAPFTTQPPQLHQNDGDQANFTIDDFPALGSSGPSSSASTSAAHVGYAPPSFSQMGGGANFLNNSSPNSQMFGLSVPQSRQQGSINQNINIALKRPVNQAGLPPLGPSVGGLGFLNVSSANPATVTPGIQGGNSFVPGNGAIQSQPPTSGGVGSVPATDAPSSQLQQQPQSLPTSFGAGSSAVGAIGSVGTTLQNGQHQPPPSTQANTLAAGDRFGLLGLIDVIRMTDPDMNMLALGCDLTSLGLNLNSPDSLCPTFMSAFSQTPTSGAEPQFSLPSCYTLPPSKVPPALSTISTLSDESLFYAFYTFCRDAIQEAAAQELHNRSWRYHKERHVWITKEVVTSVPDPTNPAGPPILATSTVAPSLRTAMASTPPAALALGQVPTVDRGTFIYFDPSSWQKVKSPAAISLDALEERLQPNTADESHEAANAASVTESADGAAAAAASVASPSSSAVASGVAAPASPPQLAAAQMPGLANNEEKLAAMPKQQPAGLTNGFNGSAGAGNGAAVAGVANGLWGQGGANSYFGSLMTNGNGISASGR